MSDEATPPTPIALDEGRFARLKAIEWWDHDRVSGARVLLVGAGALGNEVLKNLALLGIGAVAVVDKDRVEASNLSRSVLFRERDALAAKAACAARAARELYPAMEVRPIVGNVLADVGLGWFRWADVVVGALDNRVARVFVNRACALTGRPWIDGGIEVLQGIVRGFAPPATACYECTMSKTDWDLLNQQRSCSLLARRAIASRGTPTTPTSASVIGALQVQELVKLLHRMDALLGQGLVFDGAHHDSYRVHYPIDPTCGWHEPPPRVEAMADLTSASTLQAVWDRAAVLLGGIDALDLSRDLVTTLTCPRCATACDAYAPPDRVPDGLLRCDACQEERVPRLVNSLTAGATLLERTIEGIGLPAWDIVWARHRDHGVGIEVSGDEPLSGGNTS